MFPGLDCYLFPMNFFPILGMRMLHSLTTYIKSVFSFSLISRSSYTMFWLFCKCSTNPEKEGTVIYQCTQSWWQDSSPVCCWGWSWWNSGLPTSVQKSADWSGKPTNGGGECKCKCLTLFRVSRLVCRNGTDTQYVLTSKTHEVLQKHHESHLNKSVWQSVKVPFSFSS